MRLCARATEGELSQFLDGLIEDLTISDLRPAETGLVMVRGRIGGRGSAFNIGEATVTRASVRVNGTLTGFSYLLGRSKDKARMAAIVEALAQDSNRYTNIDESFLAPLRKRLDEERLAVAQKAAATRVDFFTLVRGED